MPLHGGEEFKEHFVKDQTLPDPNRTFNPELKRILQTIADLIEDRHWPGTTANYPLVLIGGICAGRVADGSVTSGMPLRACWPPAAVALLEMSDMW